MAIAAGTLRRLTGPGRKDRAWPRQPGGGSGPMVVGAHATMSWRFTKCSSGSIGGSGTHKLTTIYNFVRPPGGNIKGLTAR